MNVGIAEAKDRLSELVERAERGEDVVITRHGRAVATLSGARRRPSESELDRLFSEIKADRETLPKIATKDILQAIRDGRRM